MSFQAYLDAIEKKTGKTPQELLDEAHALGFGTLMNRDFDLFGEILAALADEPVNVLVTIGRENDSAHLDPVPANARVQRFIPQAEVLPHCAAVIHHAGAGTMFGVLSHGLPSVALPQGADNFDNGTMMADAGTAILLMPNAREPPVNRLSQGWRSSTGPPAWLV